jgi:hypothetical protein
MAVLLHWIPTFAAALILAIAAFLLDWRIRLERRAQAACGESTQPQTTH